MIRALARLAPGLLFGMLLLPGCVTTPTNNGGEASAGRWDRGPSTGSISREPNRERETGVDSEVSLELPGSLEDLNAAAGVPEAIPDAALAENVPPSPDPDPRPATVEEKKSAFGWLPWGRAKREREAAREQEEEARERESGPRISKPKAQAFRGDQIPSNTGLSPSELGRWQRDPRKAMETAREERRMVFLWLTDSKRSAPSKVLAVELFRHTRFLRLAKDYFELARVDFGEADIRSHPYSQKLKETLKVNGYPTVILFRPDGEEVWRRSGYRRGRYTLMLSELNREAEIFALNERRRRDRLDDEGYRTWTNHRGRALYAKAIDVSREEKRVTLREPSGEEHEYPVLELSEIDRDWLAAKFLQEPEGAISEE